MENGLVSPTEEGDTARRSSFSLPFEPGAGRPGPRSWSDAATASCRYADDCNIYVRSERAGHRVMESVSRFITEEAQAEGQRVEKCGGSTLGAEVPGV